MFLDKVKQHTENTIRSLISYVSEYVSMHARLFKDLPCDISAACMCLPLAPWSEPWGCSCHSTEAMKCRTTRSDCHRWGAAVVAGAWQTWEVAVVAPLDVPVAAACGWKMSMMMGAGPAGGSCARRSQLWTRVLLLSVLWSSSLLG